MQKAERFQPSLMEEIRPMLKEMGEEFWSKANEEAQDKNWAIMRFNWFYTKNTMESEMWTDNAVDRFTIDIFDEWLSNCALATVQYWKTLYGYSLYKISDSEYVAEEWCTNLRGGTRYTFTWLDDPNEFKKFISDDPRDLIFFEEDIKKFI